MNWSEIIVNRFEVAFKINYDNKTLEIDDNRNNLNFVQQFGNEKEITEYIIKYISKLPNVRNIHIRNKPGGTFRNITELFDK